MSIDDSKHQMRIILDHITIYVIEKEAVWICGWHRVWEVRISSVRSDCIQYGALRVRLRDWLHKGVVCCIHRAEISAHSSAAELDAGNVCLWVDRLTNQTASGLLHIGDYLCSFADSVEDIPWNHRHWNFWFWSSRSIVIGKLNAFNSSYECHIIKQQIQCKCCLEFRV